MEVTLDHLENILDKLNGLFGIAVFCSIIALVLLLKYRQIRRFNRILALICQFVMGTCFIIGMCGFIVTGYLHLKAQFVTESETNILSDEAVQQKLAKLSREKSSLEKQLNELRSENATFKSNTQTANANLQKQLDTLQSEKSSLEKQLVELRSENATLKSNAQTANANLQTNGSQSVNAKPNINPEIEKFMKYSETYNGHHYKLFTQKLTWYKAKVKCEKMGGHLVTITSQGENNFVSAFSHRQHSERLPSFSSSSSGYYSGGASLSNITLPDVNYVTSWIGASSYANQSDWELVTGEKSSYSNWLEYLYDEAIESFPFKRYAFIYKNGEWGYDYEWMIESEFNKHYYVCEWDF